MHSERGQERHDMQPTCTTKVGTSALPCRLPQLRASSLHRWCTHSAVCCLSGWTLAYSAKHSGGRVNLLFDLTKQIALQPFFCPRLYCHLYWPAKCGKGDWPLICFPVFLIRCVSDQVKMLLIAWQEHASQAIKCTM